MSSSRPPPTQSASTNSVRSRQTARIIAQTTADAKIQADFDESGNSFDYSTSVRDIETLDPSNNVTTAYLSQIQKSLTIQPFGCLVALDDKNLKVIAFSDNAPDLLTTVSHTVPAGLGDQPVLTLGTDLRTIFTAPSSSALYKVFGFPDVSLLNPVLVHCKTSGEPFYAIVHRVTGSIVIDFEPVKPFEVPTTASGALQSYKLAAKAIARLQSLPSGNMDRLCETMVEQVFEMTGYDRTMAYKFHDDDHGEVVSEMTKPGLEPYLGLHYPATDIPQAARFLFMKNKVRMIVDCRAKPVKVNQDENLPFNLTLCGSTLRAPHTCHLQYMENMTSIASLVMAIVVNDDEEESPAEVTGKSKRLWGLVVCHNTTPRFVPFPLRYACEFLAQVFAIHVSKELELERQILEKNILRTQTLLCDMLMRDPPLGIVSLESPNVADLVKCDGAVLLYENETYKLGATPTDSQLRDIVSWMYECHADSTGLSTDSLNDAGFPGAGALGDVVCGMAAVRITSKDMVFWFRSHTASEIQWGGARHDEGVKDDGRKMHPRSSFKAFLEVVRGRSLPWKEFEMDAIHSLQIIVRNALIKEESSGTRRRNPNDDHELETVTNEVVRLIETATVPILSVDADGLINGWNSKIADLTGLSVEEAIGIHLITLVEDTWVDIVREMLYMALQGNEKQNIEFAIRRRRGEPIRLVVNACASRDLEDNVVGVCFVAQDITGEKMALDKFTRIEGDYKAIVQNPSPLIPPIFGADEFGTCSEWNLAMTKLTGWTRDEVIGKMVLGEVFGIHKTTYCHLKNQEAFVNLGVVLNSTMTRPEKLSFGFFSKDRKFVECLLCVSKTVSGVFCFLQLPSSQLHQQSIHEQNALKMLAYTKRHARNSLNGIIFARTELGGEPEMVTMTSAQCENQLSRVLDDSDLDTIIDGNMDLEMVEFTLEEVLVGCISQVMVKSRSKGVQIVNDVAQDVVTRTLYGDSVRLQQVLSDFLLVSLDFTATGSRLNISACLTMGEAVHLAHLELRMMCHGGGGVPESVLNQMFASYGGEVADGAGISLLISRKLIRLMNGDVRYLREDYNKSTFILSLQLAAANPPT